MEEAVRLYQGDCLNLMDNIHYESVDMVLCDLPCQKIFDPWEKQIPFEPLWVQWHRVVKREGAVVLFGKEPFSSYLRLSNINEYKYDWIWKKEYGISSVQAHNMPLRDYENICVFSRGDIEHIGIVKNRMTYYGWSQPQYPRMVLEFDEDIKPKLHPMQKPVSLLKYLIQRYTAPGQTVLDNCMGGGSTGVACVQTNRNFIGIELDAEYFQTAKQRIKEAGGEKVEVNYSISFDHPEFGEFIVSNVNGKPLFDSRRIARVFGLDAVGIRSYIDNEDIVMDADRSLYINVHGVLDLLFFSKLNHKERKKFKQWLLDVVIPAVSCEERKE